MNPFKNGRMINFQFSFAPSFWVALLLSFFLSPFTLAEGKTAPALKPKKPVKVDPQEPPLTKCL